MTQTVDAIFDGSVLRDGLPTIGVDDDDGGEAAWTFGPRLAAFEHAVLLDVRSL